jgi:hypothetical protein
LAVERIDQRPRGKETSPEPVEWPRGHEAQPEGWPSGVEDDTADLDGFPVMVRLSQVQSQVAYLTQTVERMNQTIERLERGLADGTLGARAGWRDPPPYGITARANPMTHPITPLSTRSSMTDHSREDALATVRALFNRPKPWWQRLPDLLKG